MKLNGSLYKKIFELWWIILVGVLFFALIYIRPYSHDDWNWGGDIGLLRLHSWFSGYNGRYASNLMVMMLTRVPALIRTIVQFGILAAGVYTASKFFDHSRRIAVALFVMLMCCVPLEMFAHTYMWLSGYVNYVTSAVYVLVLALIVQKIYLEEQKIDRINLAFICVGILICQMILETATIYSMIMLCIMCILYFFRYRNINASLVMMLIFSVAGGVYMFSNGAYMKAAGNDPSYQVITTFKGWETLYDYFMVYCKTVAPLWISKNFFLSIILCVLGIILCLKHSGRYAKVVSLIFCIMLACFVYFQTDPMFNSMINHGFIIQAGLSTFFFLVLCGSILFVYDKNKQFQLLFSLFSSMFLAVPFIVASPSGSRCFLSPYMWLALFACQLSVYLFKKEKSSIGSEYKNYVSVGCAVITIITLCIHLFVQIKVQVIINYREQKLERVIGNGDNIVYLPKIPYSNYYCYGINPNPSGSFFTSYKEFYGIPEDLEVVFVD